MTYKGPYVLARKTNATIYANDKPVFVPAIYDATTKELRPMTREEWEQTKAALD